MSGSSGDTGSGGRGRSNPSADSRLRLLAPLGHGGMSDVWLGALRGPAGFEKLVAVKQLRFVQSETFDRGAAFLREARLAALLNHPNVVQTFEVLAQGGDYRIVMEFLEGQPLNRVFRRAGSQLALPDLIRVLADALTGLHYAHELTDPQGRPLNVVHRDVSPHNVFVSYQGGVKVLDFGIAAFGRGDREASSDDLVKGKLTYMAPEQAAGTSLDRRADVFALGVILFEVLAGQSMWAGTADAVLYGELVSGRIPSIDAAAPRAPAPLRRICAKALQVDPAQRYPTAHAMRLELDDWLGSTRPNVTAFGERIAELFAADRERIKTIIAHSLATDEQTDETDLYAPTEGSRRPFPPPPAWAPDQSPPGPAVAPQSSMPRWLVPVTGAFGALAVSTLAVLALVAAGFAVWWEREQIGQWLASGPVHRSEPAQGGCPADRPEVELSGDIDADASLPCSRSYHLAGVVRVLAPATLTIAPGTIVRGGDGSALVVEPGGRLVAEGRPDAPIVFTSAAETPAPGDWGGVVLLGRAPTNLADARFKGFRAEGDPFGGDRPDDDSGVLTYVRIGYAGMVLAPNNETNGLSLAGVGRGTRIDHVEVRAGADDCYEWFGGTVDASHLVCIDPGDDGFDIEHGYVGALRNLVLLDRVGGTDDERHGIEVDNDTTAFDAEPRTAPVVDGATLCAPSDAGGKPGGPHPGYALVVRRGAAGTYDGLWVDGYAAAVDVRDQAGLVVRHVRTAGVPLGPSERDGVTDDPDPAHRDDDGGFDEAAAIEDPGTAGRCAVPPVGPLGGLNAADRWDAGWVVW